MVPNLFDSTKRAIVTLQKSAFRLGYREALLDAAELPGPIGVAELMALSGADRIAAKADEAFAAASELEVNGG